MKRRSAAAAPPMSASCVTSATVLATAAMLAIARSAPVRSITMVIIGCAVVVWCAALAGTVPKASRAWTVVLAVVSATMVVVSYVVARNLVSH